MDIHKVELEVEGDQMELEEAEDVKPRVRKPSRKIKRKQLKLQRKKQFELPADFTTITRKSKGRVWKEYLGPDGNLDLIGNFALFKFFRKEISLSCRYSKRPGSSQGKPEDREIGCLIVKVNANDYK